MSKNKKTRQQSQEIERVLKSIEDGLKEYQMMWQEFQRNPNAKMEQNLRTQLQKLQKQRGQVRQWQEDPMLKEYQVRLTNSRQLIEAEMSRFRVSEKQLRNHKDDTGVVEEAMAWVNRCITSISVEINNLEDHDSKKQKKAKEMQAAVYRNHLQKFERIRQGVEDGIVFSDDLDEMRSVIDEFIESIKSGYSELDFDIYQTIDDIIDNGGHLEEDNEPEMIEDPKMIEIQRTAQQIVLKQQQEKEKQENIIKMAQEKEKREKEERERAEQLRREAERKERLEKERLEREEKERLAKAEHERLEKERILREQIELEKLQQERLRQEEENRIAREKKEKEDRERQLQIERQTKVDSEKIQLSKTPQKLQNQPTTSEETSVRSTPVKWSLSNSKPMELTSQPVVCKPIIQKPTKTFEPQSIGPDFYETLRSGKFTYQSFNEYPNIIQAMDISFKYRSQRNMEINQKINDYQFTQFDDPALNARLAAAKQNMSIPPLKQIPIKQVQKISTLTGMNQLCQNQFDTMPADTLLYIFHHFAQTAWQQWAAQSLNKVGWRFSARQQKWTKQEQGKQIYYDGASGQLAETEGGRVDEGAWDWVW